MNSMFLHDIKHIRASTSTSLGAPILLHLETLHGIVEVTLFLNDQGLVDRLVEAINEAVDHEQN